jgi:hypothetical protein
MGWTAQVRSREVQDFSLLHSFQTECGAQNVGAIPPLYHMSSWHSA